MKRPGISLKVHGLLLLDKPVGLSSNAAMQQARRLFQADKAGHGGTLDPLASGLLPVLFGEACKLAASSLEGDKGYEALVRLGVVTSTDDAEGEVLASQAVDLDQLDSRIEAALAGLRGTIDQVPPVYSALKVGGKPLYRHARSGTPIVPQARPVVIHRLDLAGRDGVDLRLVVRCSKGTYIRSLARDLGAALGCGAHLAGLRRTRVGRFDVGEAHTLDVLAAATPEARTAALIGLEQLAAERTRVDLDHDQGARFLQGQTVRIAAAAVVSAASAPVATAAPDGGAGAGAQPGAANDERVAVHGHGRLLGLASLRQAEGAGDWLVAPARVIHAGTERSVGARELAQPPPMPGGAR